MKWSQLKNQELEVFLTPTAIIVGKVVDVLKRTIKVEVEDDIGMKYYLIINKKDWENRTF